MNIFSSERAKRVSHATAIAVVLGGALFAQGQMRPRYERSITTTGAGPQRLAVDATLLAGANPFTDVQRAGSGGVIRWIAHGGLSDLRLFDANSREVPHLLMYPDAGDPDWLSSSILSLAPTEKTSGFEADLGTLERIDSIRVEGLPAPFLKRLMLEASGDRAHWTMLAAEATLFDLPQERLRQIALPFPAGIYRYVRITWNDTNSGRLPLPRAVSARRARVAESIGGSMTAAAEIERRPSEPGRSRYRIRLPAASLPVVALVLDVPPDPANAGARHVFRAATVTESRLSGAGSAQVEAAPATIGRSTIVRVVRDGVAAADLRIPILPPKEAELSLIVENGNNPPLDIRGVSIELAELPWIYFESPGGPLTARYGDRAAVRPAYDLEAVRQTVKLADVPQASWGEVRELTTAPAPPPASEMPNAGPPLDPQTFRVRRVLVDSTAGLVAVPLDAAALAHSAGPERRFADVRILDEQNRQVPYLIERREEPLTLDLTLDRYEPKSPQLVSEPGRNRSVYRIELPYEDLPSAQLVLETSARVFRRSVQAGVERPPDRHRRETWFDVVATGRWEHANQDDAAPALTLPIVLGEGTDLLVAVDEGDNSPLPISAAKLLLPSYRLRFFRPEGALRLAYGRSDLSLPRYDLALLAPHVMGADAREITASPEEQAGSASPPAAFISPTTFWIGLGVAVLFMIGVIAKLVARGS